MRVRVRAIVPRVDDAGLEELVAPPTPEGERTSRGDPAGGTGLPATGGSPAVDARLVRHQRPVTASDLGPNGHAVLDLLWRASRLTPAECRSLEKEVAWRWWLVNPLLGTGILGARATAVARARADGRSDALLALQTAVAAVPLGAEGSRAGQARIRACISNAGLALLVRDLVEPEEFTTLIGPWREVMHD